MGIGSKQMPGAVPIGNGTSTILCSCDCYTERIHLVTAHARSAFHSDTAATDISIECIRDKPSNAGTRLGEIAARDSTPESGAWNRAHWVHRALLPADIYHRFCRSLHRRYG